MLPPCVLVYAISLCVVCTVSLTLCLYEVYILVSPVLVHAGCPIHCVFVCNVVLYSYLQACYMLVCLHFVCTVVLYFHSCTCCVLVFEHTLCLFQYLHPLPSCNLHYPMYWYTLSPCITVCMAYGGS